MSARNKELKHLLKITVVMLIGGFAGVGVGWLLGGDALTGLMFVGSGVLFIMLSVTAWVFFKGNNASNSNEISIFDVDYTEQLEVSMFNDLKVLDKEYVVLTSLKTVDEVVSFVEEETGTFLLRYALLKEAGLIYGFDLVEAPGWNVMKDFIKLSCVSKVMESVEGSVEQVKHLNVRVLIFYVEMSPYRKNLNNVETLANVYIDWRNEGLTRKFSDKYRDYFEMVKKEINEYGTDIG